MWSKSCYCRRHSNRLHEVYVPEEFLEFSEIITGSHQDLNHLFLCLTDTNHPLLSSVIEQIAYSILLATKGRIQSPYLNMMVNFQTTPSTLSSNKTAVSALGSLLRPATTLRSNTKLLNHVFFLGGIQKTRHPIFSNRRQNLQERYLIAFKPFGPSFGVPISTLIHFEP